MSKSSFPQSVEYRGNKAVIYLQNHPGFQRYEVRYYDVDSTQQRVTFATVEAAIRRAEHRLGAAALEILIFREAQDFELLRAETFECRQDEFDAVVVGRQSFLLQIFLELLHELGAHAEHVQRFEQVDMLRLLGADFIHKTAAFQSELVAFEPDAAPEQLNDLRAFRLSDIHQPHRADPPATTAFRELFRADEEIDLGFGGIDTGEQRFGKWPVGHLQLVGVLVAQVAELGRVADIDDAKGFIFTNP